MPQARCFLSKRDWNKDSELTLKAGRILYDLFQVGPWRVNASLLTQLKNPFDFQSKENIFHKALLPDRGNEDEFIYRNCEDNIFVIWNKRQIIDRNKFRNWIGSTFREKINALLKDLEIIEPRLSSAFRAFPIDNLKFPVAETKDVKNYKSHFPKMKDSYGLCFINGKPQNIFMDWDFSSSEVSRIYFIIYQLSIPISPMPFIKEYLASKNSGASPLPLTSKDIAEKLLSEDKALCGMNRYSEAILT
ncbi:MAG: hypothetical protein HDQ93_04125, partial [Desulfovibrio sp.]|nr:hypothetical protein [Desulfovibrio sp.]